MSDSFGSATVADYDGVYNVEHSLIATQGTTIDLHAPKGVWVYYDLPTDGFPQLAKIKLPKGDYRIVLGSTVIVPYGIFLFVEGGRDLYLQIICKVGGELIFSGRHHFSATVSLPGKEAYRVKK
jgi:hypothetical protein